MSLLTRLDKLIAGMSNTQIIAIFLSLIILITAAAFGAYRATKTHSSIKCLGCLGMLPEVSEFKGWWISYPQNHPLAGEKVKHPGFVIEDLNKYKAVMIFFWEPGCLSCDEQWEDMVASGLVEGSKNNPSLTKYKDDIILYSFDVSSNAEGEHARDIYDPLGKEKGVPVTAFIVKMHNGTIAWWACRGPLPSNEIDSILNIAMYA